MVNKFLALLVGVMLCAVSLYAQANATGSLQGTVLDPSGASIPNADVKLGNKDTGLSRSMKTNALGRYRFELPPARTSALKVAMPRLATAPFRPAGVALTQTHTIDMPL